MKKLLLTGASGFLGWHCCLYPGKGWRLFGAFHKNKKGVHEEAIPYPLDLTQKDAAWKAMKELKPDAVVHLAAHSGTGFCEENPEKSRLLNVEATAALAEMCNETKARFLFISSEQVFDGEKGNYAETDAPNPKNEYGKQKLEAETLVREILPDACVLRIAVLFGHKTPAASSFLNHWLESWGQHVPVNAFHDEFRQFLSGANGAQAIFHLLEQGAEGVFHVGGETAMSRFDFGKLVTETLELPFAKINSKSRLDIEMPAYRPPDLSLDLRKITATGFQPLHPTEELKKLKPNLKAMTGASLN